MKHSTCKPTKYEQKRFDAMLRLGCVCCAQLGLPVPAVDIHHIVEGTRLGHWYTLPVCPGHHRDVWSEDQIEVIPPDLRTAISGGSKPFSEQYGTQRDLWMKVQARLKLPAVWPSSKILPRRLRRVESNKNLVPDAQSSTLRGDQPARGADGSEERCEGSIRP
jgi:hypothetical protein